MKKTSFLILLLLLMHTLSQAQENPIRIGLKIGFPNIVGLNLLNLKIGAKLEKSLYFRPEIGFALISANAENVEYTIRYPDGTTETESEALPDILFGGSPVFNLGFGVAF